MGKGKLKMIIDVNGATSIDMSNFNNCSEVTSKLMEQLEMDISQIRLKEEEVKTVQITTNTVKVKR